MADKNTNLGVQCESVQTSMHNTYICLDVSETGCHNRRRPDLTAVEYRNCRNTRSLECCRTQCHCNMSTITQLNINKSIYIYI